MESRKIRVLTNCLLPDIPPVVRRYYSDLQIALNEIPPLEQNVMEQDPPSLPPPIPPQNMEYIQIQFADGQTMMIKREWLRYENLRQPIIFRNSTIFKRFIYPILNNESVKITFIQNECSELFAFIDELNYYGIELTQQQMQSVAQLYKLNERIARIKQYIEEEILGACNCYCGTKRKYKIFSKQWNKYFDILLFMHPTMQKLLNCDCIFQMLMSTPYLNIVKINMTNCNIVYEYIYWFNNSVVKDNKKVFDEYITSKQIEYKIDSNQWIELQIKNIEVTNDVKTKIRAILNNANLMNQ